MPRTQINPSRPPVSRNPWVRPNPERTLHLSRYVDRGSRRKFTSADSPELEPADEEPIPDRIEEGHAPRLCKFCILNSRSEDEAQTFRTRLLLGASKKPRNQSLLLLRCSLLHESGVNRSHL
jgi:hypothetical protein